MDPFIGQIVMFGGNYAPQGWAFCDGQILPINSNAALFAILGTRYGGDGRTTFALPDLRGRVTVHPGRGPGLSSYQLGQRGGVESVVLSTSEIPSHTHVAMVQPQSAQVRINASDEEGDTSSPAGAVWAKDPNGNDTYGSGGATTQMASNAVQVEIPNSQVTIGDTGGSQPHTNIQPYLCINYIIALQGYFPPRS